MGVFRLLPDMYALMPVLQLFITCGLDQLFSLIVSVPVVALMLQLATGILLSPN